MKRLVVKSEREELDSLITECSDFSNWQMPDRAALELEYNVEYKNHIIYEYGDIWPTLEDFLTAAESGEIVSLTEEEDYEISNRSHSASMNELIRLVKQYRSWPQFRNMDTLEGIITGFINDQPMKMPIVLNYKGRKRIMSGNTRLDIAFMMKVKPQVLVINYN